jgi:4-hydroxybenzoate polyprenyltransferase
MARQTIPDIVERVEPLPGTGVAAARSLPVLLLLSLRPSQWTKNLIIFGALLFSERLLLLDPGSVARALAAFAIFCGLSSVVYLVNDVIDREADRLHPLKQHRPIAAGLVPVPVALTLAAVLGTAALAAAFWLRTGFGLIGALYVALLAAYSGPLKHIVIIDVLTIAIGFFLRAAAGAVVLGVTISHWLLIVTILLALFLALSKRRHELVLLADSATGHRRILREYSPYLLDQMISVVTASTLVTYAIYTVSADTVEKFGTSLLGLTLPFPIYGIFRYLYLVHRKEGGGSPSDMLLTDRPLLICVGLWAATVAFIIYGNAGALEHIFQ